MRLYDTFSRGLVELPPPPGPIRMYVCGSTVYQRVHVGNSRPFVLAMWLRSWLRHTGYNVTLVHNITDVDDKVYAEATKLRIPSRELSERATGWFFEDTDDLGLGRPDVEPKATETIPEIIEFIQGLLERNAAYVANGDVYFRVASFPEYGRLSGAKLDEMVSQEQSALKEDQRDFALWKGQKANEDAAWDSPWGPGRPGWHIECSAMAKKHLGPAFEIHGGGNDLRFPHHENELAQSRSLGHPFAEIWMHNGMLELDDAKMSKSQGNIVTLREVLDAWGREALLLLLLGGHWSKPLDFSHETMAAAAAQVQSLRTVFAIGDEVMPPDSHAEWSEFKHALDDNFNTPAALSILHRWLSLRYLGLLETALEIVSLRFPRPMVHQRSIGTATVREEARRVTPVKVVGNPPDEILRMADWRFEARISKDFEEADRLRGELAAKGWKVSDEGSGYLIEPIE